MSEPTTREQAIRWCLSAIARYQRGAQESLVALSSQIFEAHPHISTAAINDLRQDADLIAGESNGLTADLAYARGAAHVLQRLAPYPDLPEELVLRAMRGDETCTTDHARYVRGEWAPAVAEVTA